MPAGSDGVLWAPYLMGERTPHLRFVGARRAPRTGRQPHARACRARGARRRGVQPARHVHDFRRARRAGREDPGRRRRRALAALARDSGRRRTDMPVETVTAEEGAAYGAALLAGVGGGVWSSVDAACDAGVHTAAVTEPTPDAAAAMNARYRQYQRIYPALRSVSQGVMTDRLHPPPRTQVLLWPVDRRQSRPRSVRRRRPAGPVAGRRGGAARRGRRLGREPARQRSRADRRHAVRARPHRRRLQEGVRGQHARRADGDRQSFLRCRRFATARSPPTIRACARSPCRRRCARWISAPSSARRFSCSGAGAKAPRPTRAGGRTRRSSGCARR